MTWNCMPPMRIVLADDRERVVDAELRQRAGAEDGDALRARCPRRT